MLGAVPVAIAGIVWLTIPSTILFILRSDRAANESFARGLLVVLGVFFLIGIAMLFAPLYHAIAHRSIEYVVTNQRIITSAGVVGREVMMFELRGIASATIAIGLVDRMFGTGSIGFFVGNVDGTLRGVKSSHGSLRAVSDPSGVFKVIEDYAQKHK